MYCTVDGERDRHTAHRAGDAGARGARPETPSGPVALGAVRRRHQPGPQQHEAV